MKRLLTIAFLAAWSGSMALSPGAGEVKVMTRNLYLGASLDTALKAESTFQIPGIATQTWAAVLEANFPARALALANEIAAARPHLIGLQEVCLFRTQVPGDFLIGNPQPATEVALDYLALLQSELETRGLDYRVAAITTGTDVEVPSSRGVDIRLTNRDVILARGDVDITNSQGGNYAVNLEVPVGGTGGLSITFLRGWASVDATIEGQVIRLVSTHLEREADAPIQVLQALELQQVINGSPHPVVLVGDFNSRADGSGTNTYRLLVEGGFEDAWSQANPGEYGYTCCHADHLLNPAAQFNQRIDLILVQDTLAAMEAQVVGANPAGRTASGLWSSDHAGVVARLSMGATPVLQEHAVNLPHSEFPYGL